MLNVYGQSHQADVQLMSSRVTFNDRDSFLMRKEMGRTYFAVLEACLNSDLG